METTLTHWINGESVPVSAALKGEDPATGGPGIAIGLGTELANNTRFGLGAAVWAKGISRAHRMAAAIESGRVWINCYQAADSALSFGGTKESGWGRETCRETLEDYLETKTVVVAL